MRFIAVPYSKTYKNVKMKLVNTAVIFKISFLKYYETREPIKLLENYFTV